MHPHIDHQPSSAISGKAQNITRSVVPLQFSFRRACGSWWLLGLAGASVQPFVNNRWRPAVHALLQLLESLWRLSKCTPLIYIPASELHEITQDVLTQVKKLKRSTLSTINTTGFGQEFLVTRHVFC
jgi:hypothetical protein